jgi:hypothetical protein
MCLLLLPITWRVAAVNLLNPATAAKLAGMQQQQQATQVQQRPKQSHQQLDDIISSSPLLKALNDSGLNPVVARCVAKLGFSEPTPIQSACWGVACSGRDLLGHAEPGELMIKVELLRVQWKPKLRGCLLGCCVWSADGRKGPVKTNMNVMQQSRQSNGAGADVFQ